MRSLVMLVLAAGCSAAQGGPRGPDAPVVLELFTSQGCSSCPPADAVLSKLVAAGHVGGREVIPLAFHVDYWNDLGWADPFSLPAWTQRQNEYAAALGSRRIYTPQVVVAGQTDVLGSRGDQVGKAILEAPAQVAVAASARWSTAAVEITATAPADADVLVAVWEDGMSTRVTRGENSGETLGSDHVVRRLERVAAAGHTGTLTVALDPSWHTLGAVAFAQRADHRIIGATSLPR